MMALFTITWHTHVDERTCPVCRPLDGYQWTFNTDTDPFPTELFHPDQGVVWDTSIDEPRTHGVESRRGPWNCRCQVSWRFDLSDLNTKLREIKREVALLLGELEQWKTIGYVRVIRDERGRFITWTKVY